ncbi:MAG: hypothetical protein ACLGHP_05870 [Vicinamibacteria bacterium]
MRRISSIALVHETLSQESRQRVDFAQGEAVRRAQCGQTVRRADEPGGESRA